MNCENCGHELKECYRFTDWYNDHNDEYGTYDQCKKMFDEAVAEDSEARVSIYDVSECPECESFKDEGVLFNEKCPEYQVVHNG